MANDNGSVAVGTSVVPLTAFVRDVAYSVLVKADAANGGIVYVGTNSDVTAASNPATDGYALSAKEQVELPRALVESTNLVKLVASTTSQKVSWLVLSALASPALGWAMDFNYTHASGYAGIF